MVRRLIQSLLHDVPTIDKCDTESYCVSEESTILPLRPSPTTQSKPDFIQVQSRQLWHRIQGGASSTIITRIFVVMAVVACFVSLLLTPPLTQIPTPTNTPQHTNQPFQFSRKPHPRIIAISKREIQIDHKNANFQDWNTTIGVLPTQKRLVGSYHSEYSNPYYAVANRICVGYNKTYCEPLGKWQLDHHPSCNVSQYCMGQVPCIGLTPFKCSHYSPLPHTSSPFTNWTFSVSQLLGSHTDITVMFGRFQRMTVDNNHEL